MDCLQNVKIKYFYSRALPHQKRLWYFWPDKINYSEVSYHKCQVTHHK